MSPITFDLLTQLARATGEPCVSLLVGIEPGSDGPYRARLTMVAQLREVHRQLARRGDDARWLQPVHDLTGDDSGWNRGQRAVAAYASPTGATLLDLPDPVTDEVLVADHFRLVPLLASVDRGDDYVLLDLREGAVSAYRGDRFELNPFAVPDLPESLEADVWFEDRERFVTTHSGTHAGNAITATMHGQGDRGDQHRSEVDHYLRHIDQALTGALGATRPTAVVAMGPERLVHRFATLARAAPVVAWPHARTGLTDRQRLAELRQAIEPPPGTPRPAIDERIGAALGTGLASTDSTVIAAAEPGRIDTLLIATDHRGDEAPIEAALRHALAGGATVDARTTATVPGGAELVALFRY